ncbi:MAG TPA: iron-containing alcohol dehydrogenase [Firmicutes bacterium]|nr:iron-containing alcohol dehydrogenase [Bacillota bacterium]
MKHCHINNKKDPHLQDGGSFLFPGEVAAYEGAAKGISEIASHEGKAEDIVIAGDRFILNEYGAHIRGDGPARVLEFSGSINPGEFNRMKNEVKGAKILVSAGGGKCLDICKLIKRDMPEIRHIAVPTSAASCSAYTAVSVMYDKNGIYMKTIDSLPPDKIIIDYDIFYALPKVFFAAGAVDAIAKYYEMRACKKYFPEEDDACSEAAFASAEKIKDAVLEIFLKGAEIGDEEKRKLADINIILSGIVSALGRFTPTSFIAHHLAHSFSVSENARNFLHGELVGMGLLAQEKYMNDGAVYDEVEELLKAADMPSVPDAGPGQMDRVFRKFDEICRKENLGIPMEKELMYNILKSKY